MQEIGHVKEHRGYCDKIETYAPRKTFSTSEMVGREHGSCFQQFCINVHSSVVKDECFGLGGRVPPMMESMADVAGFPTKGTAPVNTWINVNRCLAQGRHKGCQRRTSIMTIAKEKISASLLYIPSSKTSGAEYRGVLPLRLELLCTESKFCVTNARPKSVMRACPELSTRMFC